MNHPSLDEAKDFCVKLWSNEYGDREIRVRSTGTGYVVEVSQMYNYVPLNLKRLMELAEFFGTKNINDSRYSRDGCETCDYGSSYEVTLYVEPEEDDNA